jgi:cellulose synthase/poly-beta-1,6-N-acetylglucosamine synthase-like glycosyltransferase
MIINILLFSLTLLVTFFVLYLWFFAIIYFVKKPKKTPCQNPQKRFLFLIPAHDEELLLPGTIKSLKKQKYPQVLFDIMVIADHCTDKTTDIAQEEKVLCCEYENPENKGKGYALNWFFENNSLEGYDAVVFVDADTLFDSNFLKVMNDRLLSGQKIIQAYNDIRNYDKNPLTRLMYVTSFLKNLLFYETKERLGFSSALMGVGMCIDKNVLKKIGWKAFSVGEDWEYYAQLISRGEKVNFAFNTKVYAQEAVSLKGGFSQRVRWAGGKFEVMGKYGFRMLWNGLKSFDIQKIDASFNVLLPNYSLLLNLNMICLLLALLCGHSLLIWWSFFLLVLLSLYFSIGLWLAKADEKMIFSVLIIPLFLVWKGVIDILSFFGFKRKKWIRTQRVSEKA